MKNISDLQSVIKGTIQTQENKNILYKTDKSNLSGNIPKHVIYVQCEQDIKHIINYANHTKTPLTSWGAGSGKSGGAIAETNGIIVSFENMRNILDIDTQNRTITVEPGVIIDDIKVAAEKVGLYYPPDPASSNWCTIGGCVAENAGGPSAVKYGVTKDYVLGLEGYFGNGDFFSLGGKCHKNVAGYDLKSLLIGQEGTLAIITKIILKVIPKPRYQASFWCQFSSMKTAISCLETSMQSSIHFSAIEFLEERTLKAAKTYLNYSDKWLNQIGVLFAYDSDTSIGINETQQRLQQICAKHNGTLFTSPTAKFWSVRKSISTALQHTYKNKCSEDITVPPAKISQLLEFLKTLETPQIHCLGYGHLGDGNIHVNILNIDLNTDQWNEEKIRLSRKIMEKAISLGGTLSGEHGIGLTKKAYMPLYFSKETLKAMKSVKALLDPNQILNPSKIF